MHVFEAVLSDKPGTSPEHPIEPVFRHLTEDDFRQGAIFEAKDRTRRYVARLAEGHRCYGYVLEPDQTVAYLWLSGARYGAAVSPFVWRINCAIPDDSVYIWDCRTVESWNGRGLYQDGLKRLLETCQRDGAKRAYIACDTSNAASVKGIRAAGFKPSHTFTAVIVGQRFCLLFQKGGVTLSRKGDLYSLHPAST